jgi:CHASE2 domain-containing sensor protein
MARKDFWKSDWFLGLGAIAVLLHSATDLVGSPERKAHDVGRLAFTREHGGDITAIAIDDASITNARRWSRDAHAHLIQSLRATQVKVTG